VVDSGVVILAYDIDFELRFTGRMLSTQNHGVKVSVVLSRDMEGASIVAYIGRTCFLSQISAPV